jgi:long-chain acyl-CoA synthetase
VRQASGGQGPEVTEADMPQAMQIDPHRKTAPPSHPWLANANYPKGIDWYAELPERPLYAIFDDAVRRYAERPFLDFLGRRYSYLEAGRLVDRLAGALQGLGVDKGVKVGLFLPNCPYFVFAYFAVLKAGGTAVLYNPLRAKAEIAHQIRDSETELMITLDLKRLYATLDAVRGESGLKTLIVGSMVRSLPFLKNLLFAALKRRELATFVPDGFHLSFERLIADAPAFRPRDIDPRRDIAALLYTGGTTGLPKGVCLSHYNLYANTLQCALGLPTADPGRERTVAVIPFFHAFGMTAVMNTSIALGAEIIPLPRFDLDQLLAIIAKKRGTMLLGVPAIFAAIANHKRLARYDLSSLKICTSGGDTLPGETKRRFEQVAGCGLHEGYGLTECSPVVASCSPAGLDKPGSAGVPVPQTVVEIVSLDDRRTPLPPGQTGEICVSGPQVMTGYWNNPEATAEILDDGRLHTGDIGYMDERGYFYLVDRLKDLIITRGYNVYPSTVEAAIGAHPAVQEVAVLGLPDSRLGQRVTAVIVPRAGLSVSEEDLRAFLKGKISSYETPKSVELVDELPKSMIGKVLKAELRRRYTSPQPQ